MCVAFIPSCSAYQTSRIAPSVCTMSKTITFVTGNKNKLVETKRILDAAFSKNDPAEQTPFELVSEKIELPEIQGTPEQIAIAKVRAAVARVRGPVVSYACR